MSEMIERVAKALAESANGGDFNDGRWYSEDHRKLWQLRARAAIAAMRNPTEEMYDAYHRATADNLPPEDWLDSEAWSAAIDVALGQK